MACADISRPLVRKRAIKEWPGGHRQTLHRFDHGFDSPVRRPHPAAKRYTLWCRLGSRQGPWGPRFPESRKQVLIFVPAFAPAAHAERRVHVERGTRRSLYGFARESPKHVRPNSARGTTSACRRCNMSVVIRLFTRIAQNSQFVVRNPAPMAFGGPLGPRPAIFSRPEGVGKRFDKQARKD